MAREAKSISQFLVPIIVTLLSGILGLSTVLFTDRLHMQDSRIEGIESVIRNNSKLLHRIDGSLKTLLDMTQNQKR